MAKTLEEANLEITRLNEVIIDKDAQLIQVQEQLTAMDQHVQELGDSARKKGLTVREVDGKPEYNFDDLEMKK